MIWRRDSPSGKTDNMALPYSTGIDTNRYNGDVNYKTAWDAGARFVITKAGGTYSNVSECYPDMKFPRNVVEAPKIFKVFGVFFYFMVKYDPTAQANFFADLVIPHLSKINLPLWCDFEDNSTNLSPQVCTDRIFTFKNVLESRTSRKMGIYTRMEFFNRSVSRSSSWKTIPLWPARYKSGLTSPWSDGYYEPLDWPLDAWDFWQYSADGNGLGEKYGAPPPPDGDRDMDLDYFHGGYEDLLEYAGAVVALPLTVKISSAQGIVIRAKPDGRIIGCAPYSTKFVVDEEIIDTENVKWYRSGESFFIASATEPINLS